MKGKIAFVLGAAVGYVLGTRAGRERYEQIKRGAQTIWNTAPVQQGVTVVKDAAQGRVDQLKDSVVKAGKGAFTALFRDDSAGSGGANAAHRQAAAASAKAAASEAKTEAATPAVAAKAKTTAGKKSAAKKPAAADADASGDA
ncbi:YtxH domain-containing protein [Leucobacter sp. CSA2]|uniref:YtxH domain-containing protein n=1 Tax=Leucobacter edaphi TaxID=2796472 RepID=A0A934UWX2_9MICO|nr:YtxH domain-containing protein [Leucobacter edaphi]MBK0422134.1 YtxH domain-containing protein [Leucobacter edaphi]